MQRALGRCGVRRFHPQVARRVGDRVEQVAPVLGQRQHFVDQRPVAVQQMAHAVRVQSRQSRRRVRSG